MEQTLILEETTETEPVVWYGCYDESWGNLISPESYSHPAKVSRGLAKRLYSYALERGWLKVGDTVLDPFGGIAGTAFDALANGLNWLGVELEARFCDLGQGCECTGISAQEWRDLSAQFKAETIGGLNYRDGRHWCPACVAGAIQIASGDRLAGPRQPGLFDPAEDASLPPGFRLDETGTPYSPAHHYIGNLELFQKYASPGAQARLLKGDSRRLRAVIAGASGLEARASSPPFQNQTACDDPKYQTGRTNGGGPLYGDYGSTPDQLGAMPAGGLVSSPPYSSNTVNSRNGIDPTKFERHGPNSQAVAMSGYGATEGQLNNLPAGDLESLFSSPPFAGNSGGRGEASRQGIDAALFDRHSGGMKRGTGESADNLDHLPMRGFDEALGGRGAEEQGGEDALFSSPPYAQAQTGGDGIYDKLEVSRNRKYGDRSRTAGYRADLQGTTEGNLAALPQDDLDSLFSSPPYVNVDPAKNSTGIDIKKQFETYKAAGGCLSFEGFCQLQTKHSQGYGNSEGQLSGLPSGSFDAALSSPPFTDSVGSDNPEKRGGLYRDPRRAGDRNLTGSYGNSEGQLGAMAGGEFNAREQGGAASPFVGGTQVKDAEKIGGLEARASSPPFEDSVPQQDKNFNAPHDSNGNLKADYGSTPGQLGQESKETFWGAARLICSESYLALKPDSYAFWVCKGFVRDGALVDFPDQWRRLNEAVGFEFVEEIRAMQVSPEAYQATLAGGTKKLQKQRKSFFRRLHESRPGAIRIDWETVIIMRKPKESNNV